MIAQKYHSDPFLVEDPGDNRFILKQDPKMKRILDAYEASYKNAKELVAYKASVDVNATNWALGNVASGTGTMTAEGKPVLQYL